MNKFLFLDLDGVLNTVWSRNARMNDLLPSRVNKLIEIVKETDCSIVISSAWRLSGIGPGSDFQVELRKSCSPEDFDYLMNHVHGKTLDLPNTREYEVLEYVDEFKPDKFAAVDDEKDHYPNNPDWVVITNDYDGLDDIAKNIIIEKLNK